jgi:peptide/nickel transport system ATP-binding protein
VENLIEIRGLDVRFFLKEGTVRAVNGVDLEIAPNRTLGVVGESGCGKSITARAMLRILPPRGRIMAGSIRLAPRNGSGAPVDVTRLALNGRELRAIRGGDIAMIFQEPMTSLSPVHTVGNQITEAIRLHQQATRAEARDQAVELLRLVGVPMPERRVDAFPHELSGGLRQRCMIAMALSCHPRLLIADEPTTALDVTIQAQILNLIERLQRELGMAVMMITHNLGVVAETADEVAVMYLGRIVERGAVSAIFNAPKHPYTRGLLESIPHIGKGNTERLASIAGSVPDPFTQPAGCPFHPRCAHCMKGLCDKGEPPSARRAGEGHSVACHLYEPDRVEPT